MRKALILSLFLSSSFANPSVGGDFKANELSGLGEADQLYNRMKSDMEFRDQLLSLPGYPSNELETLEDPLLLRDSLWRTYQYEKIGIQTGVLARNRKALLSQKREQLKRDAALGFVAKSSMMTGELILLGLAAPMTGGATGVAALGIVGENARDWVMEDVVGGVINYQFYKRELDADQKDELEKFSTQLNEAGFPDELEEFSRNLFKATNPDPERNKGLLRLKDDILNKGVNPDALIEDIESDKIDYGDKDTAKDLAVDYKKVFESARAYGQLANQALGGLQRAGVDIPPDLNKAVSVFNAAAGIGAGIASGNYPGAVLSLIDAVGIFSGGSKGPSADELILASLGRIEQQLDRVLDNQRLILRNQAVIIENLQLIQDQIDTGFNRISAEIRYEAYNTRLFVQWIEDRTTNDCVEVDTYLRRISNPDGDASIGLALKRGFDISPGFQGSLRDPAKSCFTAAEKLFKESGDFPVGLALLEEFILDETNTSRPDNQNHTNFANDSFKNKIVPYWVSARDRFHGRPNQSLRSTVAKKLLFNTSDLIKDDVSPLQANDIDLDDIVISGMTRDGYYENLLNTSAISIAIDQFVRVSHIYGLMKVSTWEYLDPKFPENDCTKDCSTSFPRVDESYRDKTIEVLERMVRAARLGLAQSRLADGRGLVGYVFEDLKNPTGEAIRSIKEIVSVSDNIQENVSLYLVSKALSASGLPPSFYANRLSRGEPNLIQGLLASGLIKAGVTKVKVEVSCRPIVRANETVIPQTCKEANGGKTSSGMQATFTFSETENRPGGGERDVDTSFTIGLPSWQKVRAERFVVREVTKRLELSLLNTARSLVMYEDPRIVSEIIEEEIEDALKPSSVDGKILDREVSARIYQTLDAARLLRKAAVYGEAGR